MMQFTNWINSIPSQQYILSCLGHWLEHSVYNGGLRVRVALSACDSVLHIGPIEMKGNCADGERHTKNHENELIMEDTFCSKSVLSLLRSLGRFGLKLW